MAPSDSELIDRIRGGAGHLYARLVDRYKERTMTLAVRMLHDRQDAEEAAQDAFVRAYNALDRFEGNAKFSTWLYRIVYNVCLTRISRRAADPPGVEFDDDRNYETLFSRGNPSPADQLETRDMLAFVRKTIDAMPPKYAMILTLFYFQDLSHEEICHITGLPLGTVKVHLFRARALLQERMGSELSLGEAV